MFEKVRHLNKSTKDRERTWKIIVNMILTIGAAVVSLPFLWMLSTSLKTDSQIMSEKLIWIPNPIDWVNYWEAATYIPYFQYLKNTVFVSIISVIGVLTAASLVAFGFAKLRAPGRNFLFIVLLCSMMLPGQVTMIPVFILFRNLGWYNSLKALTIPAFMGGGAFNIFLLRQFFMGIPNEVIEAAKIDGCSYFDIYWRIVLPLGKPALTTVAIFTFVATWNDFMSPLIYLKDQSKYTIALGLQFFQSMHSTEHALLMAAALITVLPIIIIFFFAQEHFIKGVSLEGGIKG
ncbi:MAG: sugar ABC transporter ATP-binding protein [Firmicutes bacterium HGW-Firmicutes-7]|nr:MAG: sugar ABC transporter ATP-binding protein [Firmicutes bacterium HGW-Firmicutes-7]